MNHLSFFALAFAALLFSPRAADRNFRAGAAVVDISPTHFPVLVNAMFTERTATKTVDLLTARALVLDDGETRIAMAVVDTCMIPRGLIDRAKAETSRATGIRTDRILVSATHTHSAPSAMGCLGSRVDTKYAAFLPGRIAEAIIKANARLQPARIGWATVDDWRHTFNRRWIRRSDRMLEDPFGARNVRAHMHPGYESPDAIGPSGPIDPALSVIALQTREGRPVALLANYSQHYYGSELLSSDYYGRFARHMASLLNADDNFVAIMSQGTSGDQMWMDYGAPKNEIGYDAYAREVAGSALDAYRTIRFQDWAPIHMAQRTLVLHYRTPSPERLAWARKIANELNGRLPQKLPEIYALESIYLNERPKTELILQAIRIGDLGIAAIPNEVYGITGLKLKRQSPLATTVNIELANGAEGYIPPPEQHKLGGYTTWPARTAGLQVEAEPKIVETLLSLLEKVSGAKRRPMSVSNGLYAEAVLASKPLAYWRLEEMVAPIANDSSGHGMNARIEDGIALYLPGPGSGNGISPEPALQPSNFSGPAAINRAMHFAGGRLRAAVSDLRGEYSAEFWFWNGLECDARPLTGILFSRESGERVALGGTAHDAAGKLVLSDGSALVAGKTPIARRTWHHLLFVRGKERATLYLNGRPEISAAVENRESSGEMLFAGDTEGSANFEGKLDEVAVYDRALSAKDAEAHYSAAGLRDLR